MADQPYFAGRVRKGDRVQIPIDGTAGWVPRYYDVIDCEDRAIVKRDQVIDAGVTDFWGLHFVDFPLEDEFTGPGSSRSLTWYEGRHYAIVVKENQGQFGTDNTNQFVLFFQVDPVSPTAFLGVADQGDNFYFVVREENWGDDMYYDVIDPEDGSRLVAHASMSQDGLPSNRYWRGTIDTDDLTRGKTYFVRVKDNPVEDPQHDRLYSFTVIAPLKRVLGLCGENMVLDNFAYDQAGNIVGLRIRLFDSATNASNATQGSTDPEPGEIVSYDVDQEHNAARNVRTFHSSVVDYES